mmetsp:Transcript_27806/g.52687  ORF Transcript_27806/g.52687 Transcript_27806/m.52687 type:complete len:375 (+) Transcript_27806:3075-4199(+)
MADFGGRSVDQDRGGLERPDPRRLRKEEQRQRCFPDPERDPRHHSRHGDPAAEPPETADFRDRDAGAGAKPNDRDHDQEHQRPRRGDRRHDYFTVRGRRVQQPHGLEDSSHLGHEPPFAYQAHLRFVGGYLGGRPNLRYAQERVGQVHHLLRPPNAGCRLPVRRHAQRQRPGQGDPLHCHGPSGRQPPDHHPSLVPARARLPEGPPAARIDSHPAQRAHPERNAVLIRQRLRPVLEHLRGQPGDVDRHGPGHDDRELHAGKLLAHHLHRHRGGPQIRQGEPQRRRRNRQRDRLQRRLLREGSDVALRPLPRVLHDARIKFILELQLPRRQALEIHELFSQVGPAAALLRGGPPTATLPLLCRNGERQRRNRGGC